MSTILRLVRRVRRSGDQGFTLIELLVVCLLLGVVGSIVASGLISGMRADRKTRARIDVTADMAKGVDRMTKQIRVASPVVAFTASSISVETYRNNLRYRYTYAYDATAKTVTETLATYASASAVTPSSTTSQVLLTNITNGSTAMFRYYDRDGAVATAVKDVARVEVSVVETPTGDQQAPIGYSTSVFLRNYQEQ